MVSVRAFKIGLVAAVGLGLSACSSIRESRGYITDPVLTASVQPGIDNKLSVEGMLGRPSFVSLYGEPVWYYVSSRTYQKPFVRPRIREQSVMAIRFDGSGNVSTVDFSGMESAVYLRPDGDKTPADLGQAPRLPAGSVRQYRAGRCTRCGRRRSWRAVVAYS